MVVRWACRPGATSGRTVVVTRLTPYIIFPGIAREALEFYRDVFGGELQLTTYAEYGLAEGDDGDQIMHGILHTDAGFTLMGADTPPGAAYVGGTNVAANLSGHDAERLLDYWHKLTREGTVTVPLGSEVWGDEFGMCTDRYGTVWRVDIVQPQI
jgi:PhnB protein